MRNLQVLMNRGTLKAAEGLPPRLLFPGGGPHPREALKRTLGSAWQAAHPSPPACTSWDGRSVPEGRRAPLPNLIPEKGAG